MQGQITLSKKEKRFQFLYLIFMLMAAMILLGIIFLNRFQSPFTSADVVSLDRLEEKAKFDSEQKKVQKIVDSTFKQISRIKDEIPDVMVDHEIDKNTAYIRGTKKRFSTDDSRVEGFPQIAKLFEMYYNDKKTVTTISFDTKNFERRTQECIVGYRDKERRLFDRDNNAARAK
jgi:hypothetical protein